MNDHKELLEILKNIGKYGTNNNALISPTMLKAADAIEQLVKERDAAVAYIPSTCFTCKHFDGLKPTCKKCNWEWRGVQDDRA